MSESLEKESANSKKQPLDNFAKTAKIVTVVGIVCTIIFILLTGYTNSEVTKTSLVVSEYDSDLYSYGSSKWDEYYDALRSKESNEAYEALYGFLALAAAAASAVAIPAWTGANLLIAYKKSEY